jgi:muramoyltetrapeptide carboxypeptidase
MPTSHSNKLLSKQFNSALIIAPSGVVNNREALTRGIEFIENNIAPVKVDPSVSAAHQRFAGTDDIRLAAINALEHLSEPTLVVAARGGYGLSRLLPSIKLSAIAERIVKSGSVLCGHSDMTALQLALLNHLPSIKNQQATPTVHGPMVCFDFGAEQVNAEMSQWFNELVFKNAMNVQWQAEYMSHNSLALSGRLWGGNLAMICSLLGTPFFPAIDDGVLVIEDVNEHPYRIERMLLQLLQAGVLEKQKALVFGQFSDWSPSVLDQGYNLQSVAEYIAKACSVPVITGFPFGHVHLKASLPLGRHVELVLQDGQAELKAAF